MISDLAQIFRNRNNGQQDLSAFSSDVTVGAKLRVVSLPWSFSSVRAGHTGPDQVGFVKLSMTRPKSAFFAFKKPSSIKAKGRLNTVQFGWVVAILRQPAAQIVLVNPYDALTATAGQTVDWQSVVIDPALDRLGRDTTATSNVVQVIKQAVRFGQCFPVALIALALGTRIC